MSEWKEFIYYTYFDIFLILKKKGISQLNKSINQMVVYETIAETFHEKSMKSFTWK